MKRIRQPLLKVLGAPALSACVAYAYLFGMPQQRQLDEVLKTYNGLNEKMTTEAEEAELRASQLAAMKKEEARIVRELESAEQFGKKLVTKQSDTSGVSSSAPASRLSAALQLLQEQNMSCISSRMIPLGQRGSDASDSLLSLSDTSGIGSKDHGGRREVRLQLQGRFEDCRSALRMLQQNMPEVFVVVLEMESSSVTTDLRTWNLIIFL